MSAVSVEILAERAAADAAAALLSLGPAPQVEVQAEVQAEPEAQADPPAPITGNKRNRGHLKSKGSILHNPARGEHAPEYRTVNYKRCRNTFYSQAEAEAALNNYKAYNICPCCERPNELECEQCGHTHGDPIQPAQAPVNPVAAPEPAPAQSIRCVALGAGVIQVTINGITLTIDGAFTYP